MKRTLGAARTKVGKLLLASGVAENPLARRLVFRLYYDRNAWGDAESRSGAGSNLAQTAVIRQELPGLFARHGISSVLDVPCGDGHWWALVDHDLQEYVGADIVPSMIEHRRATAGSEERFLSLDVATASLPRVDAIFCRDLLVHMSDDLVATTLANFKRSGAEYLITTTFPEHENRRVRTGRWRPLDLQKAPFNFPEPLELLNEGCTEGGGLYADKSLGVWRLSDVPIDTRARTVRPAFHRCQAATSEWVGLELVENCACGAIRVNGQGWVGRPPRRLTPTPGRR